jgi:hypothetical protein
MMPDAIALTRNLLGCDTINHAAEVHAEISKLWGEI